MMWQGSCPYGQGMMFAGGTWWWPSLLLIGLVVLAVVLFAVVMLRRPRAEDAAVATLRNRFAAGELSVEEFEAARKTLG